MSDNMSDKARAEQLGMTIDQFQKLVGHDSLDIYPEFIEAGSVTPCDNGRTKPKAKDPKK